MLRSLIRKTIIQAIGVAARFFPPWATSRVVDVVPQIEWTRVKSPVNVSGLPAQFASQFVRAKNIPSRRIFELHNVFVTSEGVTFRNLRIFLPSLPWSKDLERYRTGEFLTRQWKRNVRTIGDQPLILGFDHWAMSNYYHWMIESLPRLYLAQAFYKDCKILLPEDVHEYVIASLELLDFNNLERIGNNEVICVHRLILPEIIYYNGVENEDEPPPQINVGNLDGAPKEELILPVRRKLLGNFSPKTPYRKVYVSRSRSRIRRLVNEREILPVLQSSGFEIVFFEGMTLMEQIRLMQETSVFCGVHGSNMVNLLFLPTTAKVIELMNEHQVNDAFYLLSSTIGVDYHSVPCSMKDEFVPRTSDSVLINDADLVVDVGRFENVLKEVLVRPTISDLMQVSGF
ncbi:MAG TPA: glycosyltransferase family 61 protein [Chryseosolibacter sp.]